MSSNLVTLIAPASSNRSVSIKFVYQILIFPKKISSHSGFKIHGDICSPRRFDHLNNNKKAAISS